MRYVFLLAAALISVSACDEDTTGPTTSNFSVAYQTTFTFDPNNQSVVIVNGAGTASGLGEANARLYIVQSLNPTVQPNTMTASTLYLISRGDTLKGNFTGTSNPPLPAPAVTFTGPFTITSGTGRFAGATGSGTFSGSANLTNATGQVTFTGQITH
jgi:hypothetical protein